MSNQKVPTRLSVLRMLQATLGESNFDCFCLEAFRDVYSRFTNGLSLPRRRSMLLDKVELPLILSKLQDYWPWEYAQNEHLLEYEE